MLTRSAITAVEKCNVFLFLFFSEITILNTLSVNCKLTRLRCVLLSFLIAKTVSLFYSQFTVQFFPLTCHCLIWKLKRTLSMSHNNNEYGGRGPSLSLSHTTPLIIETINFYNPHATYKQFSSDLVLLFCSHVYCNPFSCLLSCRSPHSLVPRLHLVSPPLLQANTVIHSSYLQRTK